MFRKVKRFWTKEKVKEETWGRNKQNDINFKIECIQMHSPNLSKLYPDGLLGAI